MPRKYLDMIKLSVVTVCRNSEDCIAETIQSVINQTYPNIEYILIDGNSNDNTLSIIKKYRDMALKNGIKYCWLSEPDNGIYEAMNKGIDLATGDWINFMNAGDKFYSNTTLECVYKNILDIDVVYGKVKIRSNKVPSNPEPLKLLLDSRKPFNHQSAFVRIELYKENKFDLKYKICSDYHFFKKIYKEGYRFKEISCIVSIYDGHGISNSNLRETLEEDRKIAIEDGITVLSSIKWFCWKNTRLMKNYILSRIVKRSWILTKLYIWRNNLR